MSLRALALALALALSACAAEPGDPLAPEGAAPSDTAQASGADPGGAAPPVVAAAPEARSADPSNVPHIYMALQPDASGLTSVILAIDASRDTTPSDDPAVRITPENGQCNPQQLRFYNFPAERRQRPIYGPEEAARGITARELPDYMAMAVTSEMMIAGLAEEPEDSQPQNVCTRKLLQRMILDRSTAAG